VGRLRDAVTRPLVQGAAERLLTPRINALREARGLAPVTGADDFFRRAGVLLVATSEPFEYHHPDWGDRVRMIGALAWEPPAEVPAWLTGIEGPIALVTTSSEYQADEALVRAAFEGLSREPFTVVATMPAGVDGAIEVPPSARLVDFVPHGAVLDRTVVAVTHGGMGATQKALARGIPVCVVPFGRDQLEVAARVVTADCGTKVAARRLTAESLRVGVREAMTKVAGARRVAEGYAAAGGAAAGASAVEELLRPATARTR
jgi:MGT family glycosyltransferase